MQTIPGNLVAAGYVALCAFFENKCVPGSDGDPREDATFLQNHAAKKIEPKQPATKKTKRMTGKANASHHEPQRFNPETPHQQDVVEIITDDEDIIVPRVVAAEPTAVAAAEMLCVFISTCLNYFWDVLRVCSIEITYMCSFLIMRAAQEHCPRNCITS